MSSRLLVLTSRVAATGAVAALLVGATSALGGGAAGAAGVATRARTITVTGVGQVRGTPDVADLAMGVSGRGDSANDTLAAVSDRAANLIGVLHDAGIGDADIQTRDLSINPTFDDQNHITGYQANNTVVARLRDLTKAGAVVDAATAKVGDNIRLQGITFSIDDDSALLASARTQATKRARAQAGQLADGAGVHVGDVVSIHETSAQTPMPYAMSALAAGVATPVEPGTQTLSVSATVVYAIS